MDKATFLRHCLRDINSFAECLSGRKLRQYQREVAATIASSVISHKGLSIVVVFPRQSGKNELQAQIETYLLQLLTRTDAEIVKVSPTYKPQTMNAMRRLQRVLERNLVTRRQWEKESGYIYKLGGARIFFLSGDPTANVVGATASTLLECDEAQDVTIAKWDKDFAPMAASTDATRVFWGTMWTSRTLLARELRAAREAEQKDAQRRVFIMDAGEVAAEVPAYGRFVAGQVARLGRDHPFVKTQYFSEEIDAEGGMFPPERQALMQGSHPQRLAPDEGKVYALLLDVAGQDESSFAQDLLDEGDASLLQNPARDATALTVVEVQLESLQDELVHAPTYHVVDRHCWVGTRHTHLYGRIKALVDHWKARYLVVDATGVGAGIASFLDKAFPNLVIPFVFTSKSKSDLGWGFLSVIETGRYKEYRSPFPLGEGLGERSTFPVPMSAAGGGEAPRTEWWEPTSLPIWAKGSGDKSPFPAPVPAAGLGEGLGERSGDSSSLQSLFWTQVSHCQSTVLEGPGKLMRWGVPAGDRDSSTGDLVHDDLLVSAALCTVLDFQQWGTGISRVVAGADIFAGMKDAY